MKGKIVLIPFPFTDLTATKLRPALVLHEGEHDVVVAFISSKTPVKTVESGIQITSTLPGFSKTGLKADSVIRLDKVATILKDLIVGEIGELDDDLRADVNAKIATLFRL